MRKLLRGLLLLVLVISLASCADNSTTGSSEQPSDDKPITNASEQPPDVEVKELVFYSAILKEEGCKAAVKGFEEETGVQIKIRSFDSADFVQAFMVASNGGSPIDVMLLNGQDVRAFSQKGLIQDLNSLDFLDRLLDAAIEQYTFNGKLYGLGAKGGNSSGIFVNLDVYEKYDVKVPTTLEEMIVVNNKLKENGVTLFGFGGASKYMWPMWFFSTFAQTSNGKPIERTEEILTGKAKFTDADSIEAFTVLQTFAEEGMFQLGFNGTDTDGGKAAFFNGQGASFYGGTWEIAGFRDAGMNNMDLFPFPVIKDGATSLQTGNASDGAYTLFSRINPDNQEMAVKLIEYLTRDSVVASFRTSSSPLLQEYAVFTANKNVPLVDDSDPIAIKVQKEFYPMTFTHLDWIYPPEVTTALQDVLQSVTGVQITPDQAGQKMQEVVDDLLENGYDFNATK